MDDGTYIDNSLELCTHSFTKEEVTKLIYVLENKFSLICKLRQRKIRDSQFFWYTIHISTKSMPLLWQLVKPQIIPSIYYKFGKFVK